MHLSPKTHARIGPVVRLALLICIFAGNGRAQDLEAFLLGGDSGSVLKIGAGDYDVTGRGRGTVSGSDQMAFAGAARSGDFDLQVRVVDLEIANPHVRAGLMVRATTNANSPFLAVFASSGPVGCFLESRSSFGGASSRVSIPGGFPSAPPNTWLRIRREGSQWTGYASVDGNRWTRLESRFIEMPAEVWTGLAVSSQNATVASQSKFRGLAPTAQTTEVLWTHVRESATPSSRRTGLVISEIQYHPADAPDGTAGVEFVEISNHGDIFQELTGWRLTGGVEYRFPDGFKLEAGAMVLISGTPDALRSAAGLATVLGPWTGSLDNAGEVLELRDNLGAIKLHVEYSPNAPWPTAADGTGHSLVLISPSYGEEDPRAWAASWQRGGSPGRRDPLSAAPLESVVINEFLAHTDLPQVDFIELFNRSTSAVDLSGWILTDDARTNRLRIPQGTLLAAGAAVVFEEGTLGFRLSSAGETLSLLTPDAMRIVDSVRFVAQENGVSTGRSPDGLGNFRRLAVPTPGALNAQRRAEDVVINEIFYNPPGGDEDEFVEIHHRGTVPVDLTGWRLRGGIAFDFPAGSTLQPGGFLVIAANQVRLKANHPTLSPALVMGNFSGTLNNGSDVVALTKPDEIRSTNQLGVVSVDTIHIRVGEVRYVDGGSWGKWSDGGGSSLELIDPDADPALAANWADSDESEKAAWSKVQWTGRMDNGDSSNGVNRLFLGLLNDGECLVDDIEVLRGASTNFVANPGFEVPSPIWSLGGNHAGSTIDASGARNGARGLHLRAQGGLDTGINSIRGSLGAGLAAGNIITIRASVRWIAGWPELLFRIRGNFADYAAPLPVPANLGTPGRVNSRRVSNAGPAIYEVTHSPAVPRANESVLITARASDPDSVTQLQVRHRIDPGTTFTQVTMRDDGLEGDQLANDGIFTAQIPAQGFGTLLAYTITGTDGSGATSVWPRNAPADEALIRWGDQAPFGTFPHVHLWATAANRSATGGTALNNAYRRCTLVYGNTRVIYSSLFRDKGSPFHSGSGDITTRSPDDEKLHGVSERLFSKTGNGGPEETALRGRVAAWMASQMGVPSLNGKYQFFYVNGASFANLVEDQEEPDHRYAEHHQPDNVEGDLYKISIWFEFADGNTQFNANQATLDRFLSDGQLKLARYRWNWERRAQQFPESNYQTIFDLVGAINSTADANYVARVTQQADMDQWMRVFAFHRVTGNWDSWTYNVGQNMYLYRQPGRKAVLFPWDIDFVFGLGDPISANLWGGQDGVMNSRVYDNPTFRRMLWRALLRAAEGPMLPERYQPVIDSYRAAQVQNNVTSLGSTAGVTSYINGRRATIVSRYRAADVASFAITSNGGADFTASSPTVTLTGNAPLRVAEIAVNGVRLPVNWTGFTTFSINVPLTAATNDLRLVGLDGNGSPLADFDTVRVVYPGAIPVARDWVVINEIHYNPAEPGTSFIELHNRNTSVPFNLAGYRLDGVGYIFPASASIPANGYLLLTSDRAAFATRYGAGVAVFGEFTGGLDNGGERLRLLPPDSTNAFGEVRYLDRSPWPTNADGFGPSLQLLDPAQDTRRPANWAATATNAANRVTPGAVNATRTTLATFPGAWINEVFPQPANGIVDNAGDADPFVELHNPTAVTADLSGLWLSDSLSNLSRWAFPAGTQIAPGGFLRVWLDNEPSETGTGHLHAGFRIPNGSGLVALSRAQGSPVAPAVLDWIEYNTLQPGRGFGSIPDGNPFTRRPLYIPTPGANNNAFVPAIEVVINEFMAQNTTGITDPADGDFDDWIELYNPGVIPADLSGYFLTDNLTNKTTSILPPGTLVPAGGFLLVWADNEPQQTDVAKGRFHARFNLSRSGEQLGLYAPDGTLVDGYTFGEQSANVSMGRYPDGQDGDWTSLQSPTPEALNFVPGGNLPPRFSVASPQVIPEDLRWTLQLTATDPDPGQSVHFSLGTDAPAGVDVQPDTGVLSWTPDETQGPGGFLVTVRATDNGTPPRSSTLRVPVQVTEVNRPPVLAVIPPSTVAEGSLLTLNPAATDADIPTQTLSFELTGPIPAGMSIDTATGQISWIPSEPQGPGQYDVTVQVTDSGTPPATASRPFRVTVEERDNPPTIAQPEPQIIDEGSTLVMTIKASDPDGAPVRFALQTAPPTGLTLDPVTGVIRWTPTEEQGPGSYPLIIQVTEQSTLAQTAQATFSILVREANQPPTLAALPALVRFEDDLIELPVSASDTDLPPQNLFYSLENTVPGVATINPQTGRIRWRLPADIGETNLTLQVRVSDDAFPPLSANRSLNVRVLPRFRVMISEIMNRPVPTGSAYVELLNPSMVTAWDLSGVQLSGRQFSFTFPPGTTIQPGRNLCVAGNLSLFRSAHGDSIPVAGPWVGSIGADGDDLRLRAMTGELLDRVAFTSGAPWPEQAAGGGVALQLIDPLDDNARPGNWSAVASYNGPRQPVAYGSEWRYLETGTPDANWNRLSFDDRGWKLGTGLLYNDNADLPAPKRTLLPLGQSSYYFRARFVLPAVPAGATLSLSHIIDDAAVFYLNGQELTRFNFNPGTVVTPTTLADVGVGDAVVVGPVTLPANLLQAGTNVFAVEVHQNNLGSSDIVFGAQLDVVGGTQPGLTPGAPNNVASSLPEFPEVYLNEFSPVAGALRDNAGEAEPWVEIINSGLEPIQISGWTLNASGVTTPWSFPAGSAPLQPRERRLVFLDGETGEGSPTELHASFRPVAGGGWLSLARPASTGSGVVDFLTYGAPVTDRTWSTIPEGQSFAREWAAPSPGKANPVALVVAPVLGARWTPAGAVIRWIGTDGVRYRLESADGLDEAWMPVARVTGSGASLEVSDPAQPAVTRFYRVIVE
jgi:hypothetical protein